MSSVAEGVNTTAPMEFRYVGEPGGGCLIAKQTTIVHGTALGTPGLPRWRRRACGGLLWSPVEPVSLQRHHADRLAIQAGVSTIALAPDWSLGGSVSMLDELRTARRVSDLQATVF